MYYVLRIKNWKIIAAGAAIILAGLIGWSLLVSTVQLETEFIIGEGQGLYEIADFLGERSIIKSEFVFLSYVLATGNEKKLKAGRYVFEPGDNIVSIVNKLAKGLSEPDDVIVTIPEGSNVWEIDGVLARADLIQEGDFAGAAIGYEGRLFPDSYRLRNFQFSILNFQSSSDNKNSKKENIVNELINKMLGNFEKKTNVSMFKGLSVSRQKEIIIIASMLEKEAKSEGDMRLVSGVIKNRLEKGTLLQIDATVAYGACLREFQSFKVSEFKNCDVTQVGIADEIKINGPYNTYTRAGLPVGAISNPGLKSIEAALNPAETDYLYYLSTRDGGQIIFSKTAAEQAVNRSKYLGI